MNEDPPRSLPAARVEWPERFLERLSRFVDARRAERSRAGAVAGRAGSRPGAGLEFAGYRPLSRLESVERVDWTASARGEEPLVRLARVERGERWCIALDSSASMGLGPPGKLSLAAQVAAALGWVALHGGAEVEWVTGPSGEPARFSRVSRAAEWIEVLGRLEARGSRGLGGLIEALAARRAERVVLLGDGADLDPRALTRLARPGRCLSLGLFVSPDEFDPPLGWVEWLDPESQGRLVARVDAPSKSRFEERLRAHCDELSLAVRRARGTFALGTSRQPFEDLARALLVA